MATKETETPPPHHEDGLPLYSTRYGMKAMEEAANELFEKSGEDLAPGKLSTGRPP